MSKELEALKRLSTAKATTRKENGWDVNYSQDLYDKDAEIIKQHIQTITNKNERLAKEKRDLTSRLNAIREVVVEKLNRLDGIITDLEAKLQSDVINTYWVKEQLKYWNTVAEDYRKIKSILEEE